MKKPRYVIELVPITSLAARIEEIEDDGYVDWEWDFLPNDEPPSWGEAAPRVCLRASLPKPKPQRAPRKPKANIPIEDHADA